MTPSLWAASAAVVAFTVAGCVHPGGVTIPVESAVAGRTTDGDTLRLMDGRVVRLVQVDSPEHDECFGRAAGDELARLVPRGTSVWLLTDPALDERDEHGRLLRYLQEDAFGEPAEASVNVELVRLGAAVPYFFRGDRGLVADELLDAAGDARRNRRGLWGACPGARFDPQRGALTGPA